MSKESHPELGNEETSNTDKPEVGYRDDDSDSHESGFHIGDFHESDENGIDDTTRRADQSSLPYLPTTEELPHLKTLSVTSTADKPIFSIIAYCSSSILMTVTNKYVLSGHNFNLNFFLLAVQAIICVTIIQTLKIFSVISFHDFSSEQARKWFPIALLLVCMIYTGTKALQYLSIPTYTIFKNLTIILIAYGEVLWFGGSVTKIALASFVLMIFSSIVASWADTRAVLDSFNKISTLKTGYIWMLVNCFCTAAFVLFMRKRIKLTNFKDFDTMFYNNLLSIPVLVLCSLGIEDWSAENLALNFPAESRTTSSIAIFVSGVSAIFISYTTAWCLRVTSSTTFSMIGALNKLPIAISGLVFFHAPVTPASVSAIALGIVSGVIYTVDKTQNAQQKSQPLKSSNSNQRDLNDDRSYSERTGFLENIEVAETGFQEEPQIPAWRRKGWWEQIQTVLPRKS